MLETSSYKLRLVTNFSFISSYCDSQDKMEAIQNQVLKIISNAHQCKDMEEIVHVSTSLFQCLKKEGDDIISDINDLGEENNNIISDLKDNISILEKILTV